MPLECAMKNNSGSDESRKKFLVLLFVEQITNNISVTINKFVTTVRRINKLNRFIRHIRKNIQIK